MVYAIVENGGKQYKAVEGEYLDLDLLPDKIGEKRTLDKVLLLANGDQLDVGNPYVSNVMVETIVQEHFKGPKITVFKYRPRQRYRVKTGHRQNYTRVIVDSIVFPGKPESSVEKDLNESEMSDSSGKKSRSKPSSSGKKNTKKPAGNLNSESKKTAAEKKVKPETQFPSAKSIEDLDLGARTTSALKDAGIKNFGQLAKKMDAGDDKLKEIPGIGEKSIQDIKKKMKKFGYSKK